MKFLIVFLAGLSIAAIIALAALQLIRVIVVEARHFLLDAWRSAQMSSL